MAWLLQELLIYYLLSDMSIKIKFVIIFNA